MSPSEFGRALRELGGIQAGDFVQLGSAPNGTRFGLTRGSSAKVAVIPLALDRVSYRIFASAKSANLLVAIDRDADGATLTFKEPQ